MNTRITKVLEKDKNSKLREQMAEYHFVKEMIISAARQGKRLEVSRCDQDLFGYDVILKVEDSVRYVQLKSAKKGGKTSRWDLLKAFVKNPDSRIVIIMVEYTENNDVAFSYKGILDYDQKRESILTTPSTRETTEQPAHLYCRAKIQLFSEIPSADALFTYLFPEMVS